jgi:nitroreductase
MDFDDLVKKRRSIHHFTNKTVSNDDLLYILEAARWAPSAGNNQPWRFVVVRTPETIEKI